LDRRRGLETELLCPGEPTPITLSVTLLVLHRDAWTIIRSIRHLTNDDG